MIEKAERLEKLPPYLFKEIDRKKAEVMAGGVISSIWAWVIRTCPHRAILSRP